MSNNTLPPNPTVAQEVEWYKAELGTWNNLNKAWDPSFKADFKRLSGNAIQAIITGDGYDFNEDRSNAFGMAGAYQRLITTEQLNAMGYYTIKIIYPSLILSPDFDVSKVNKSLHLRVLISDHFDYTLAADDPRASWVSKLTTSQIFEYSNGYQRDIPNKLFRFWTNEKNLSKDPAVALPYLNSIREKLQAIHGEAIAYEMGYGYGGSTNNNRSIDPLILQFLTTEQMNVSFKDIRGIDSSLSKWLDHNFKDIAALKRKDVVIQQLSADVVNAMAVELARTSRVDGEFGHWVWGLSDQQIQGLSKEAGLALFKAWVSHDWLDETYSPNKVVNDTLARQVKNFSSSVVEAIIQTNFGLAARYQWLLTAEQVNGLSLDSLDRIFGTIAQRTDLTSGFSQTTVNNMAIMLDQKGRVNGEFGHWVWGLSDQQIQGLSKAAGLALFKAWVDDNWLDTTYSPEYAVNDTLARQVKNFSGGVIDTIIQTPEFGLAARYQWLLSAQQVIDMSLTSRRAIAPTIRSKFKEEDLPWGTWMGIGGPPKLVENANVAPMLLNQSTIQAELLIQRMASATNVPSANTNVFNPNAPLGASTSNQALVAVH